MSLTFTPCLCFSRSVHVCMFLHGLTRLMTDEESMIAHKRSLRSVLKVRFLDRLHGNVPHINTHTHARTHGCFVAVCPQRKQSYLNTTNVWHIFSANTQKRWFNPQTLDCVHVCSKHPNPSHCMRYKSTRTRARIWRPSCS